MRLCTLYKVQTNHQQQINKEFLEKMPYRIPRAMTKVRNKFLFTPKPKQTNKEELWRWFMPRIPALRRLSQENCSEFEGNLSNILSCRPERPALVTFLLWWENNLTKATSERNALFWLTVPKVTSLSWLRRQDDRSVRPICHPAVVKRGYRKLVLTDVLSLARLHVLKVSQPSWTAPAAGDHVLKHVNPWGTFHIQTTTDPSQKQNKNPLKITIWVTLKIMCAGFRWHHSFHFRSQGRVVWSCHEYFWNFLVCSPNQKSLQYPTGSLSRCFLLSERWRFVCLRSWLFGAVISMKGQQRGKGLLRVCVFLSSLPRVLGSIFT